MTTQKITKVIQEVQCDEHVLRFSSVVKDAVCLQIRSRMISRHPVSQPNFGDINEDTPDSMATTGAGKATENEATRDKRVECAQAEMQQVHTNCLLCRRKLRMRPYDGNANPPIRKEIM